MITIKIDGIELKSEYIEVLTPVLHDFYKVNSPAIYQLYGEYGTFLADKNSTSCERPYNDDLSKVYFRARFEKEVC